MRALRVVAPVVACLAACSPDAPQFRDRAPAGAGAAGDAGAAGAGGSTGGAAGDGGGAAGLAGSAGVAGTTAGAAGLGGSSSGAGGEAGAGKVACATASTCDAGVCEEGFCAPGTLRFLAPAVSPLPVAPLSIALGDVDHDGHLDLAISLYATDQVAFRLGSGTGAFDAGTLVKTGDQPARVQLVDLDADDHADLLVSTLGAGKIEVRKGSGGGAFGSPFYLPHPKSWTFVVRDVDGASGPDIVAINNTSPTVITTFLADGKGLFTSKTTPLVGSSANDVAVGKVFSDGNPDVAVARPTDGFIAFAQGDGTGAFLGAGSLKVGKVPTGVAMGDLDGDGSDDIASADCSDATATVLFMKTGPVEPKAFPMGQGSCSVLIVDLDGDGPPELVTLDGTARTVSVRRNLGGGSLGPRWVYGVGGSQAPVDIAVGDVNGDGKVDLVIALGVAFSTQAGAFSVLLQE